MADSKYLGLLIACIVFWAILSFGLSALNSDSRFSADNPANASYGGNLGANITTSSDTELSLIGFRNSPIVQTMIGLFGFRLYVVFDMPTAMSFIVSLINYILVIISAVCIYRLVNPIA